MITCIIAEKPSVARDIARIVGATNKQDGYMEGSGYLVTWAMGHLITLAMPEAYGFAAYKAADKACNSADIHYSGNAEVQVSRFFGKDFAEASEHDDRTENYRGLKQRYQCAYRHITQPPFSSGI